MAKRTDAETLSSHLHALLRDDLLNGEWAPGAKLQLTTLSTRYETSSTVVREALTRLTGERLVVLVPNRGFFVPELSLAALQDITELRCVNEEFGLKMAIERGSLAWESELIAVHHTLERTPYREDNEDARLTPDWVKAHQAFHSKLIEASGIPPLVDLCTTLSDVTQLYNRWAGEATRFVGRDVAQEHREILQATLDRDAALAARLIRKHYEVTLHAIEDNGAELEAASQA
ncbi:MAG: GntR family transcriptional regulator [Arthrobacter sp.]|jgi:DNA-binding GntR family transcriptional regulator|nr:GntR family transcriptional regulator [Arthrobacter sp.]